MDLVCVGDNITDCYPQHGVMCPGGNCVNVAVHASRAGASAAYVGRVGTDARGDHLRQAVSEEGVDVTRMVTLEGATGFAEIRHSAGDRTFGGFDRGVARFEPTDQDLRLVESATTVHTSYSAGLAAQVPTLARRANVSYDFDDDLEGALTGPTLPLVTYAFFSASHLARDVVATLLRRAHERGPSVVAATLGADGALTYDGATLIEVPAPTTTPIDTLGAGDAFIGTLLAALHRGEDLRTGAEQAVVVATHTCSTVGGFGHDVPLTSDLPLHHVADVPHQGAHS